MKRGEIWLVNLDPTIGSEIRKKRPAVIVSRDSIGILPLKIIVPITGWRDEFAKAAWLVPIERDPRNGIVKKSAADAFQVRSISEERLIERLGMLGGGSMEQLKTALALTLGLD
ncbi:MAG: type II toxin-antitoxin system PemK/MazF family toxin [Anaerolineales bacterium]